MSQDRRWRNSPTILIYPSVTHDYAGRDLELSLRLAASWDMGGSLLWLAAWFPSDCRLAVGRVVPLFHGIWSVLFRTPLPLLVVSDYMGKTVGI